MKRGFTLPELLVGLALLGLIGIVVMQVYVAVLRTSRFGSAHLDVQESSRTLLRRLIPLVESAMPQSSSGQALLEPVSGASGGHLVFVSSQDHLGEAPVDPRAPQYRRYRIDRRPDDEVFLEQVSPAGPPPRRLGRVRELEFSNLDGESVRIRVSSQTTARTLTNEEVAARAALTTVIYLPYALHQASRR